MSASTTSMHAFAEELRIRVPSDIHPSARLIISEWLNQMATTSDASESVCLAHLVRDKIADELRWEAEKYLSLHDHREAYRLRRRADRFEVAHA